MPPLCCTRAFGKPVRAAVEKGDDIIPSTKKLGGPGSVLVMPLTNKDSIWSFDHMDAAEITIPDAPHPDELVVAVVLARVFLKEPVNLKQWGGVVLVVGGIALLSV